eukprot:TRINITY_DN2674_c0_g1_i1.p2 TRINITY_DN2674_c0_g1~~TRINITY_DN2674_c0_g1_i1.p2  ORF type:complete len:56 (+),score=11.74 TRINITY_DN2674_c0_g1_i1:401-568(+)
MNAETKLVERNTASFRAINSPKDFDGATKPAYPTVLMAERRQELRVGENNSESDA